MRRCLFFLGILVLSHSTARAQEQPARAVLDLWDVAYLQGARAGYVHTMVHETEKDGVTLLRSTLELRLTVKRSGDVIQLGMDTGTLETPEGKVVGVFTKQFLGKKQTLSLAGIVSGDMLNLTLDNSKPLKPAPWKNGVVGLYAQQSLFREKNLKPGDRFEFTSFEPSINLVVTQRVEAKDYEDVELFAGKQKQRLLRVETRTPKVQGVQLPPLVTWVDRELAPARMEMEIPGLGKVTLYRTTKQVATSNGGVTGLTDIGLSQYVKLTRAIPRPLETTAAVYRITIRDDEDPASAFSRDDRQQVRNLNGNTVELRVKANRASGADANAKEPGAEYGESSYFINCADAKVKDLARRAVGSEKDPWKKALRIERWVHEHLRPVNHEALATADHVARTLEGDCTEYAMLTAAMCRAEGVPSRTAVGLIYANVRTGPVFAFHMWTEVWVGGQWAPIDSTLGRGYVGAVHLKVSDQSWHEERTMAPLLPVVRLLGRLSIQVISTEGR